MPSARPERLLRDLIDTPIAQLQVFTDPDGVVRVLDFDTDSPRTVRLMRTYYGGVPVEAGRAPAAVRDPLDAYFAGEIEALTRVPWRLVGTDFQQSVWRALVEIPAGTTTSYGALALKLGRPAAVRAVGAANGANPVGVVIPCHRVIGADGSLTGYGGGLERKRWLLDHERRAFALS
ncbi:MAG: methylated-DNA--[protein]-cysteine S-methyltransferase [Pseudomonadota bacterium]